MAPTHICSASNALYRVFVLPSLRGKSPLPTVLPSIKPICYSPTHLRSFTRATSPLKQGFVRLRPSGNSAKSSSNAIVTRFRKNDEITARQIEIVDSATGRLREGGPRSPSAVLRELDLTKYQLTQVTNDDPTDPHAVPVCRIDDLAALRAAEVQKYQANREARLARRAEPKAVAHALKTLELNWAIDANDLGHRLEKFREFLESGRRVEVILARKKRGRQATAEECAALLTRLEKTVAEVKGAKVRTPLEGNIGGKAAITYQGAPRDQSTGAPSEA